MANYTVNWTKEKETRTGWEYTASTRYRTDGFLVWKGKYRVFSIIHSADEWHLERLSDHRILHSGRTAKECMGVLEWAVRNGKDTQADVIGLGLWSGVCFDDDFNPVLKLRKRRGR